MKGPATMTATHHDRGERFQVTRAVGAAAARFNATVGSR
jgi:hypothetical protein